MTLTKAKAKKSCAEVWNKKRKGKGKEIIRECAYCKKYKYCKECPLYKLWGFGCFNKKSPFSKFVSAKTEKTSLKWADVIYRDIKRS